MRGRFSIEAIFKAVDRITAPISKMQNRMNRFIRTTEIGLKGLNRAVDKTFGAIAGVGKRAIIGATVLATAAGFAIKQFTDEISELHDTTKRLNFPIEAFQEWSFVAKQNGMDQEQFNGALDQFNKRIGETRAGTGAMLSFLKRTDRALLKQIVSAKDNATAFELYISAMRKSNNVNKQAAMANAAFGRGAKQMVNIAQLSAKEIEVLRREQQLNGVITQAQAEAVDELGDNIDKLMGSVVGLRNTAFMPLVPTLNSSILKLREWIVTNREVIGQKVERTLKFIVDNFEDIVKIVAASAKIFGILIGVLVILKIVVLAGNAALIIFNTTMLLIRGATLAYAFATVTLTNALKIARIAALAFMLVMSANPIGLVIVAIVALIAAIVLLIKNWDAVVAGIKAGAMFMWKWLKILFPPFKFLESLLTNIFSVAKSAFEFIAKIVKPFKDLKDGFKNVSMNVKTAMEDGEPGADGANGFNPSVVSPEERVARNIEEQRNTSTAEVLIRDETGRAEIKQDRGSKNSIQLQTSSAF